MATTQTTATAPKVAPDLKLSTVVQALGVFDELIGSLGETFLVDTVEGAEEALKVISPIISSARNTWVAANPDKREAGKFNPTAFSKLMAAQVNETSTVRWTLDPNKTPAEWKRFRLLFTLDQHGHTTAKLGTFQLWAAKRGNIFPAIDDYATWLPTASNYDSKGELTAKAKADAKEAEEAKSEAERKAEIASKRAETIAAKRANVQLTPIVWDADVKADSRVEEDVELVKRLHDLQALVERRLDAGGDEHREAVMAAVEATITLKLKAKS